MTETKAKAVVVAALAELLNRDLTKPALAMYVEALSDLPAEQVTKAAGRASRTCKFMPSPVELRELAGVVSHADRAMLAYAAFERAIESVGGYKSPNFDDPVINATVRHLGGWTRLCEMPCSEFDRFVRPQFLKAYESLSRAGVNGDHCRRLVGEFERTNAMLGFARTEDVVQVATGLPWAVPHAAVEDQTRRPLLELKKA